MLSLHSFLGSDTSPDHQIWTSRYLYNRFAYLASLKIRRWATAFMKLIENRNYVTNNTKRHIKTWTRHDGTSYQTTLHYTTLHFNMTLHYATLHYTTLYTTLHLQFITLHGTTLHYSTLHCTELHYILLYGMLYNTIPNKLYRILYVPYHTILYHAIPYYNIPCHTIQYYTIPFYTKFELCSFMTI